MTDDLKHSRSVGAIARTPVTPLRVANNAGSALAGPIGIFLTWLDRYRQRRILDGLSDHMLKDMGVSRADVDREVRKSIWRD